MTLTVQMYKQFTLEHGCEVYLVCNWDNSLDLNKMHN